MQIGSFVSAKIQYDLMTNGIRLTAIWKVQFACDRMYRLHIVIWMQNKFCEIVRMGVRVLVREKITRNPNRKISQWTKTTHYKMAFYLWVWKRSTPSAGFCLYVSSNTFFVTELMVPSPRLGRLWINSTWFCCILQNRWNRSRTTHDKNFRPFS